jgi:nucleotide-binding universal stress UspA family protein
MILVPFNFNLTGENAIKYAIEISKVVKLDLVVFHATETKSAKDDKVAQLEIDVKTIVDQLNKDNAVKISIHVAVGDYEEQIEKFADDHDIRAILVGTRKVNGIDKILMEGRTARFLNSVTLPIFIVPEDFKYKPIEKILWASDFNPIKNDDALDPVVNLAKFYDAEVRIAHVKTSANEHGNVFQHNERHREDFLFSEGIKHSFKKIRRSTVSKGIKHYLNLKGDNDLLVLVKRKHGFLDTLFKKEHSLEFSVNPELPVFILHEDGRKLNQRQ